MIQTKLLLLNSFQYRNLFQSKARIKNIIVSVTNSITASVIIVDSSFTSIPDANPKINTEKVKILRKILRTKEK